MKIQNALYLVPVPISDAPFGDTLPEATIGIVGHIRHFIVENVRSARRHLRRLDAAFPIDDCTFFTLDRHTRPEDVAGYLQPLREGHPMAVMSEAGCPAVADPGSFPVEIAQREGLKVIPLVGPSSILLSLMGSGFNGQGFAFHGYLPLADGERRKALKRLEAESATRQMTQIFIETPYRNNRMLRFLTETLQSACMICVACDITEPEKEEIISLSAKEWSKRKYDFDKRPAIFLIYAGAKGGDTRRYEKK